MKIQISTNILQQKMLKKLHPAKSDTITYT